MKKQKLIKMGPEWVKTWDNAIIYTKGDNKIYKAALDKDSTLKELTSGFNLINTTGDWDIFPNIGAFENDYIIMFIRLDKGDMWMLHESDKWLLIEAFKEGDVFGSITGGEKTTLQDIEMIL